MKKGNQSAREERTPRSNPSTILKFMKRRERIEQINSDIEKSVAGEPPQALQKQEQEPATDHLPEQDENDPQDLQGMDQSELNEVMHYASDNSHISGFNTTLLNRINLD